jgi:membrane protein
LATVPFGTSIGFDGSMNPISEIVQRADRFQQRTSWLAFPVSVWKKFGDDRAGNLAALIACNGFASVFPLLLVLVTLLDITMKNYPGVKSGLEHSALAQYPVIGPEIVSNVHSLSGPGS